MTFFCREIVRNKKIKKRYRRSRISALFVSSNLFFLICLSPVPQGSSDRLSRVDSFRRANTILVSNSGIGPPRIRVLRCTQRYRGASLAEESSSLGGSSHALKSKTLNALTLTSRTEIPIILCGNGSLRLRLRTVPSSPKLLPLLFALSSLPWMSIPNRKCTAAHSMKTTFGFGPIRSCT